MARYMEPFCGGGEDVPCQIQKALGEVKRYASRDPERAHAIEDEMRTGVLKAIAFGRCALPDACASIALKTEDYDFPRGCA